MLFEELVSIKLNTQKAENTNLHFCLGPRVFVLSNSKHRRCGSTRRSANSALPDVHRTTSGMRSCTGTHPRMRTQFRSSFSRKFLFRHRIPVATHLCFTHLNTSLWASFLSPQFFKKSCQLLVCLCVEGCVSTLTPAQHPGLPGGG